MPRTSLKTTCLCLLLGILASGAATLLERLQETPPDGVLEISAPLAVAGRVVVPDGVSLRFASGGWLDLAPGSALVVNGPLLADENAHIFRGTGAVRGALPGCTPSAKWFGAVGDGKHDDTRALQRAADAAATASRRKMLIPPGRYRFTEVVTLRCGIDCKGVLVKEAELDPRRASFSQVTFTPAHALKRPVRLQIVPDTPPVALDPKAFGALRAGLSRLPKVKGIPTLRGDLIDLERGGTLRFSGTDFFSSRRNQRNDQYYTPNDFCVVSTHEGHLVPELQFSYTPPADARPWDAARTYRRGEYCMKDGRVFKATFPSGPGTAFRHRFHGDIPIGPVEPNPKAARTHHRFTYPNGARDAICLWLHPETAVEYTPPQPPLDFDGLAIEVTCASDLGGKPHPVHDQTLLVNRGNLAFRRLSIRVLQKDYMPSSLMGVDHCANLSFHDCHWSGATYHGLGYNISHTNCRFVAYTDCTSENCRDSMAGRHGRFISIHGGKWGCIDDHYGDHYTIENAVIHALSTTLPGYCTPKADLAKWHFAPRTAFIFAGTGHIRIENCQIHDATGIFTGRGDIGDLGGHITIRNCTVHTDRPAVLFTHTTAAAQDFDYAHRLLVPAQVLIENIALAGSGHFTVVVNHQDQGPVFPLAIRNCGPIRAATLRNVRAAFARCAFDSARFKTLPHATVEFHDCRFAGKNSGVKPEFLRAASGNSLLPGATTTWPLEK